MPHRGFVTGVGGKWSKITPQCGPQFATAGKAAGCGCPAAVFPPRAGEMEFNSRLFSVTQVTLPTLIEWWSVGRRVSASPNPYLAQVRLGMASSERG